MSKCKVVFKDLENLQKKLNSLKEEQIQEFNESVIKELAARLLAKVIKRTPVGDYEKSLGKKGGTLRRGWTIGEVIKTGNSYSVEIINPVEYASYVEFGHRTRNHKGWVNGRFMMTISEQELENEAPKIIEKRLQQLLGESFK